MRLAITGLGMLTSVGHDAATACASIRAGIQRPRELLHYTVLDGEEQESKPLIARPIHGITDGFMSIALWMRLAMGAAADMQTTAQIPPVTDLSFWKSTGVCMAVPDVQTSRFADDDAIAQGNLTLMYGKPLLHALLWNSATQFEDVISQGHTGVIEAVARAAAQLEARRLERVIILCADSYIDLLSLEWLDQADRLKSDENPFGLIPGEAGACLMIESVESAQRRGVAPIAYIESWSIETSAVKPLSDEQGLGIALANSIEKTLSQAGLQSFSGLAISDLNGEPWRAHDWGSARVRLGARLAEEINWLLPCDSLGDTGTASSAVSLCVAAAAFKRGYANSEYALVTAQSDTGTAASVCMRAAQ